MSFTIYVCILYIFDLFQIINIISIASKSMNLQLDLSENFRHPYTIYVYIISLKYSH